MNRIIERIRYATWRFMQPLTHVPAMAGAPVSDLFIWRNSDDWETRIELIDLPGLFSEADGHSSQVVLVFFDAGGHLFLEETKIIKRGRRDTILLSDLIGVDHGLVGTFSIFHTNTPSSLQALGSHLAERGYVSYRYRGAPLCAYVHGNLDAVARLPNLSLQMLGGQSVRSREYRLQHALSAQSTYELAMVNATPKPQRIVCEILSSEGQIVATYEVNLASRGSALVSVSPDHEQQRIVIRSRVVMTRPLVFRVTDRIMDVFHG
jgi:hypothetical protein